MPTTVNKAAKRYCAGAGARSRAASLDEPVTRYAVSGRYHIAYQVLGDGPADLVVVPGFVSNLELQWQLPGYAQRFYATADAAVEIDDGRVVTRTGDGILAVFDGPVRAIRAARAIRAGGTGLGLRTRCGVHTAEVELVEDDVVGIGVHVGARVAAAAAPGEVWVSRTVRDLIAGSGCRLADRGTHALAGLDETWALYAVEG